MVPFIEVGKRKGPRAGAVKWARWRDMAAGQCLFIERRELWRWRVLAHATTTTGSSMRFTQSAVTGEWQPVTVICRAH